MITPSASVLTPPSRVRDAGDKARFWNRVARKYAAEPIADMAGYETSLRRIHALLSPSHTVLEIGCGTGSTALRLAAGTRRMLASDVSAEMIAIAREKLGAAPQPNLSFEVADCETLASNGATYDAVLALNLLHLVSDLDAALSIIVPLLKPGGLFISKTPCLAEMNPLIPRVLVPLMRRFGKAPDVMTFDADHLRRSFERHGLVIDAVERHGSKKKDFRVFIVAIKPH